MGDVVNLRLFRKARERQDAGDKAEANRLAFGRTKIERDTTAKLRDRDARHLDGHLLGGDEPATSEQTPDKSDA